MDIKQVLVIRKDLKMRRGKEIAQGSHGSLAFITRQFQKKSLLRSLLYWLFGWRVVVLTDEAECWLSHSFTKICLQVNSEEELLAIHHKAKLNGLESHLVQDSGRTEFNGVPTYTVVALGPNRSEDIDAVTGGLSLY